MRKQRTSRRNTFRIACMALAVVMAASVAMAGCSRKQEALTEATVETEAPMGLKLSCYLTGTATFTDVEGREQTSIRFLVKNDDQENKDWVKGLNGKEYLNAGNEKVQVYSRYINDNCRYVDASIPGNVKPEDVTYTAGTYTNGEWKQAGDEQYHEIGAIVEDGIPYFYTGCGVSTGLAGERVMCVWLAGFTPDSVPVDGSRPRFGHADHFSLVTSDGKEIPAWEGLVKEPELSVNEFGVEISIQAEDEETLMRSISRTGLTLRHRSEEGVVSDFELERKAGFPETPDNFQEATDTAGDIEPAGDAEGTGNAEGFEADGAGDTFDTNRIDKGVIAEGEAERRAD